MKIHAAMKNLDEGSGDRSINEIFFYPVVTEKEANIAKGQGDLSSHMTYFGNYE